MNHTQILPGGISKIKSFGQKSPGVELVVPHDNNDLLTVPCRRLIGALTRRMLPRVVRARRTASPVATTATTSDDGAKEQVDAFIALASRDGAAWSDRISDYGLIAQAQTSGADRVAVQLRGLGEDESAVLVDGRPAPACIVDLAVAVSTFVEPLRNGEKCLLVINPQSTTAEEAEVWESLVLLCQDRLGIERGVLEMASAGNITSKVHALA